MPTRQRISRSGPQEARGSRDEESELLRVRTTQFAALCPRLDEGETQGQILQATDLGPVYTSPSSRPRTAEWRNRQHFSLSLLEQCAGAGSIACADAPSAPFVVLEGLERRPLQPTAPNWTWRSQWSGGRWMSCRNEAGMKHAPGSEFSFV
jgi:hypothetical protein